MTKLIQYNFIGICAVSLSFQTSYVVTGGFRLSVYEILLFSLTIIAYNASNLYLPQRIFVYTMAILALSIGFIFVGNTQSIIGLTIIIALPYFYGGKYSPRNFTFIKPIYISIIWILMTVVIPPVEHGWIPYKCSWHELTPFILEQFFFVLALVICYDQYDAAPDRKNGLKTIYLRYGQYPMLGSMAVSLLLSLFWSFLNYRIGFYSSLQIAINGIFVLATMLFLSWLSVKKSHNPLSKTLIDSCIVLKLLILVASAG